MSDSESLVVGESEERMKKESLMNASEWLQGYFTLKEKRTMEDKDIPIYLDSIGWLASQRLGEYAKRHAKHEFVDSRYEGLHTDFPEYEPHLSQLAKESYSGILRRQLMIWIVVVLTALVIACVAALLDIGTGFLQHTKFSTVAHVMNYYCDRSGGCFIAVALWIAFVVGFALFSTALVTFIEPKAAGSGFAQVKSYMNGLRVPFNQHFKVFVVRVVGLAFGIAAGLAIGQEGPMIHVGASIGAGVGYGRHSFLYEKLKVQMPGTRLLRYDKDRRFFTSMGAAAGLACAFGSPLGGLLFMMEEGANFWKFSLTFKAFSCCVLTVLFYNVIMTRYEMSDSKSLHVIGILNLGTFPGIHFSFVDILVCIVLGALGGVIGATYIFLNGKLANFRKKYVSNKYIKMVEVVLVAVSIASIALTCLIFSNECMDLSSLHGSPLVRSREVWESGSRVPSLVDPVYLNCPPGTFNVMGNVWLRPGPYLLRGLFHDPPGTYPVRVIGPFSLIWICLSCWCLGLAVPAGLFVPNLVAGASFGRLLGEIIYPHFKDDWCRPEKMAFWGSVAVLNGIVRYYLALTAVFVESTDTLILGFPIMIILFVSKWVGDKFTINIYTEHLKHQGLPLLPEEPPVFCDGILAKEVMSTPVLCLHRKERVANVYTALTNTRHKVFPIVDGYLDVESETFGKFAGLIDAFTLNLILYHKAFIENNGTSELTVRRYQDAYPNAYSEKDWDLTGAELGMTIDCEHFMMKHPFFVTPDHPISKVYRLITGAGLRHIVVLDHDFQVRGIVSRCDLARYQEWHFWGNYGLHKVPAISS